MIKKYFDSRFCLILAVFIGLASPIIVESFVEEKKYSSNKIGIDTQYIDGSINEKDDFYRYVNGKWLDNVSIPADENSWGSFMELRKNVLFQQHEVIDELNSQDIEAQTDRQRVYGLYQSYMNLVIINKLGLKPLANYLESINSIEDNKQLVDFFC